MRTDWAKVIVAGIFAGIVWTALSIALLGVGGPGSHSRSFR
jgi:hypothetical protein